MKDTRESAFAVAAAGTSTLGAQEHNDHRFFVDGCTTLVVDGRAAWGAGTSLGRATSTAALAGALSGVAQAEASAAVNPQEVVSCADELVGALHTERAHDAGIASITVAQLSSGPTPTLYLAWLGDCPALLLRGAHLQQLTRPHTRAQQMVEDGRISLQEAALHPASTDLTRAAGMGGPAETWSSEVHPGDKILVCTRGVPRALGLERLARLLARDRSPQQLTADLIAAAQDSGETESLTAVVMHIDPGGDQSAMNRLKALAPISFRGRFASSMHWSNPFDGPTTDLLDLTSTSIDRDSAAADPHPATCELPEPEHAISPEPTWSHHV